MEFHRVYTRAPFYFYCKPTTFPTVWKLTQCVQQYMHRKNGTVSFHSSSDLERALNCEIGNDNKYLFPLSFMRLLTNHIAFNLMVV